MIKTHYHPYAITRLLIVVTLLMSATFAADAEQVDYQRAAKIAQKYITLRNNTSIKAQAEQQEHSTGNVPYYIFNGTVDYLQHPQIPWNYPCASAG